jgi:hypothetical protein
MGRAYGRILVGGVAYAAGLSPQGRVRLGWVGVFDGLELWKKKRGTCESA